MGAVLGLDFEARSGLCHAELPLDAAAVSGPSAFIPALIADAARNRLEIEVEVELDKP